MRSQFCKPACPSKPSTVLPRGTIMLLPGGRQMIGEQMRREQPFDQAAAFVRAVIFGEGARFGDRGNHAGQVETRARKNSSSSESGAGSIPSLAHASAKSASIRAAILAMSGAAGPTAGAGDWAIAELTAKINTARDCAQRRNQSSDARHA